MKLPINVRWEGGEKDFTANWDSSKWHHNPKFIIEQLLHCWKMGRISTTYKE